MITYNIGLCLKTKKFITKDNIITMCKLLNNRIEYSKLCKFEPERISEGGIIFKFNNSYNNNWYKSVRFQCYQGKKWYWINDTVMSEWTENNDIIFDKNIKFNIFCKSFYGAPIFTIEELQIWEECFYQIGIVKIGKYLRKENLIN